MASPEETLDLLMGRWRHFDVPFSILWASSRNSASASRIGGVRRVWRPYFYGNEDGGSNLGGAAMVVVVGSSLTCPPYCLGLFVAVESKLQRWGHVVYDD